MEGLRGGVKQNRMTWGDGGMSRIGRQGKGTSVFCRSGAFFPLPLLHYLCRIRILILGEANSGPCVCMCTTLLVVRTM